MIFIRFLLTCCKGCRALEFTCSLLLRLYEDRQVTLSTAASEVYTATLYQYHTWYTSAAFTVALKVWSMCIISRHSARRLSAWARVVLAPWCVFA